MRNRLSVPFLILSALLLWSGPQGCGANDDDVAAIEVQDLINVCDQSVRNYRLLTPRSATTEDNDRFCDCVMTHSSPWGFPKITVDCSDHNLESAHIKAEHLPFGTELLDFSWNALTAIPRFQSNLKQLKTLQLNDNQIEAVLRHDLANYTYLVDLNLANNRIAVVEEMAFNDLVVLKRLSLANNALRVLPDYIFRKLKNIIHLTLSGNDLNELLLTKNLFYNLHLHGESLQVLGLEYCNLTWLNVESASGLLELRLRGNAFAGGQLPQLSRNIKLLDMSANPLRRLDHTFYSGQLRWLEVLLLEDMPNLYQLAASSMATFRRLRKLSLQGSRNFTYFDDLTFDGVDLEHNDANEVDADDDHDSVTFEALNEIILTGTKVKRLGERLSEYLPNVELIDLQGCPLLCGCDLKWLMGGERIVTNGICDKPLSMLNRSVDQLAPETIQNCSYMSRFLFRLMNGFLIFLLLLLGALAMYFLVMGCRPTKQYYVRQRFGANSPYSRITVEPVASAGGYRPHSVMT